MRIVKTAANAALAEQEAAAQVLRQDAPYQILERERGDALADPYDRRGEQEQDGEPYRLCAVGRDCDDGERDRRRDDAEDHVPLAQPGADEKGRGNHLRDEVRNLHDRQDQPREQDGRAERHVEKRQEKPGAGHRLSISVQDINSVLSPSICCGFYVATP